MYKLPNLPSTQAGTHEMADFAELMCWDRGSVSMRKILAYLGRIGDNDYNVGCDDDDDQNAVALDEVMIEIERREKACGSGYPFKLDLEGTVLRRFGDDEDLRSTLYRYLLLSTRLNMMKDNVHASIDGCLLFEEVCAHVLKNYLGSVRSKSLVFGTAAGGSFENKVIALCHELREGSGCKNPNIGPITAKDGKLDVVAWVPFSDFRVGQLIIFSQCKTGTTWENQVAQLQPDAFIRKWIDGTIAVFPVRAFCVSEAYDHTIWNSTCIDAGIFLDRCRLVDFCDNLNSSLLRRVSRWTTAAKKTIPY